MLKLAHRVAAVLALLAGAAVAAETADDQPVGEGGVAAVVIGRVAKPGSGGDKVAVPFLLLKDGRAYQEEASSPLDFRPGTRPPGSWGVFAWERTAGGYRLAATNGGTEGLRDDNTLEPLNAPLQGRYLAHGGSATGSWRETVVFGLDGSYWLSQSTSMSGMGMMGSGGWQSTGRYAASPWSIAIEGFGRPPERKLFARSRDGNHVVIGDKVFVSPKAADVPPAMKF